MTVFSKSVSEIDGGRPEFLTAREVSLRLRLPLSTVYYLAKTGALSAVHIGRSWRFSAAAVAALAGRQKPATRVLVVDDNVEACALVSRLLAPRGHLVVATADGQAAALAARQRRFDWLLIDFKLPDRDGVKLLQDLHGTYSLGQMIMMTAFDNVFELDKLFGLGAVTLLRKPIKPYQLIECVERRLSTGNTSWS